MNFLAHAVLSFDDKEILVGNMISDFVKGKKKEGYPQAIRRGIQLHRLIDNFTDFHSATSNAKSFFRQQYGLYAGPFIDIVYDYFLANDPAMFATSEKLLDFSMKTYAELNEYRELLPPLFSRKLPYMKEENWLYNYRTEWGIDKSFHGLVRRAKYMDNAEKAVELFLKNKEELEKCYQEFFPELKSYVLDLLMNRQAW